MANWNSFSFRPRVGANQGRTTSSIPHIFASELAPKRIPRLIRSCAADLVILGRITTGENRFHGDSRMRFIVITFALLFAGNAVAAQDEDAV
jgi:hypothetical protein